MSRGCYLIFAISLAFGGCDSLSKVENAPMAQYDAGEATITSSSSAYQSFVNNAEPAFRSRCVDCHTAGGRGSSRFLLNAGALSALTSNELRDDFTSARAKLLPDDGCDVDSNLILLMIREPSTHEFKVTDPTRDPIYLGIRQWIIDERGTACSQRPPAPDEEED